MSLVTYTGLQQLAGKCADAALPVVNKTLRSNRGKYRQVLTFLQPQSIKRCLLGVFYFLSTDFTDRLTQFLNPPKSLIRNKKKCSLLTALL
jgi:hypothetical protein